MDPWQTFTASLAAYRGQAVRLRRVSFFDRCLHLEGTFVDDLTITHQVCRSAALPPG